MAAAVRGLERELSGTRRPRGPVERTAAGDQALIPGTLEAAASGPQVTEGNLPGAMFTAAEEARRAGKVAPPPKQPGLFGSETGALRIDSRPRVKLKDTGETGPVVKFNENGTVTVDTPSGKRTVEPEAVEFLAPEPLGKPRPVPESGTNAPRTGTPAPQRPSDKLIEMFQASKTAFKKQTRGRHTENVQRSGAIKGILDASPGEAGTYEAMKYLKAQGKMPRADLLRQHGFGEADVDGLFRQINEAGLMGFDELSAREGLLKLLDPSAPVPQPSEIKLLEGVFGHKFVDTLTDSPGWRRVLFDVLNLPRALAASIDMSAPLRQGLILTVFHFVKAAKAFGAMHRFFFNEKYFNEFSDALRRNDYLPLAKESGLHLATLSKGAKGSLSHGEEVFRSNLAENLPLIGRGVRASERAYMGYLDKLRMDVFTDSAKRFEKKLGLDTVENIDAYKSLAEWINIASGRGSLGKLERIAEPLGLVFFSPRFAASRIQAANPLTYVRMHPAVRQQAIREMLTVGAVGLSVTGLAYAAGAKVELDPRSTDFGKLRVGHTRVDISGGFQPYVRLAAQLAGGTEMIYQRKGGKVSPVGRAPRRAWT
jgi:hypothetical protein